MLLLHRYVKFDTFHPAVDRGLPVTRVISRVVLQQLLAEAAMEMAGEDVILNDQNVMDYQHEVRAVELRQALCASQLPWLSDLLLLLLFQLGITVFISGSMCCKTFEAMQTAQR